MHDNIITQNVKLIDEKIIIDEIKCDEIRGVKYIQTKERKKVANATPTNSIAFLKTPTYFIEPK